MWQKSRTGPDHVYARVPETAIVWPTHLDPWRRGILDALVEDVERLCTTSIIA